MADLTDVIADAVADAGLNDTPDTPETPDTPDVSSGGDDGAGDTPEPVADEGGTAPEPSETPTAPEPPSPAPTDDVDAWLAETGIKPPIPGQRENRIPHSRVKKMVETQRKKWEETHKAKADEAATELTTVRGRLSGYEAADRVAATDPARFLRAYVQANPAARAFVQFPGQGGTPPGGGTPQRPAAPAPARATP